MASRNKTRSKAMNKIIANKPRAMASDNIGVNLTPITQEPQPIRRGEDDPNPIPYINMFDKPNVDWGHALDSVNDFGMGGGFQGNITRGNGVSSNTGWLGSVVPFLVVTLPNLNMPSNYGHYHGYPSNITSRLGDLSGYTEVSAIHLENLNATQPEIEELDSILKGGIIING